MRRHPVAPTNRSPAVFLESCNASERVTLRILQRDWYSTLRRRLHSLVASEAARSVDRALREDPGARPGGTTRPDGLTGSPPCFVSVEFTRRATQLGVSNMGLVPYVASSCDLWRWLGQQGASPHRLEESRGPGSGMYWVVRARVAESLQMERNSSIRLRIVGCLSRGLSAPAARSGMVGASLQSSASAGVSGAIPDGKASEVEDSAWRAGAAPAV